MNTKGDMTLNIIMVAVILLITVLVVIAIFMGQMGKWGIGVEELRNKCPGTCKASCDQKTETSAIRSFECTGSTSICCIRV